MSKLALIPALVAALIATPALAGSRNGGKAYQVGNDSYNVHLDGIDMSTVKGRAQGLALIEKSAARLCDGIQPRVDFNACKADTVKNAASGPQGSAIALALRERATVQTAAR